MTIRNHEPRAQTRRTVDAGFSVVELLVVLAIMGIFITFAGPAFTESYRAYKVRSASQELSVALRAVRQVAVSTRSASNLLVNTSGGSYSWTDAKGKTRSWVLPNGVSFISANPSTITFVTNGTVSTGSASIILQGTVNGSRADRWTLNLNTVGQVTSSFSMVTP
ncbi:MAG: prepilin-type N-terminal cleavage/methylation domain-containing protein [Acidobacteria bacterium]|nr:prepilin-type N-terminal cleavage/methylation domain-containing protein [Acidobacteriota bacterium]